MFAPTTPVENHHVVKMGHQQWRRVLFPNWVAAYSTRSKQMASKEK